MLQVLKKIQKGATAGTVTQNPIRVHKLNLIFTTNKFFFV